MRRSSRGATTATGENPMSRFKLKMAKVVVAVILVSAGLVPAAWAGYKASANVSIDLSNRFAMGSLADARSSTDSTQFIGCESQQGYAVCQAQNTSFSYVYCYTHDAALVAAAAAVKGDSFVRFDFDQGYVCTRISSGNYSFYPAKITN